MSNPWERCHLLKSLARRWAHSHKVSLYHIGVTKSVPSRFYWTFSRFPWPSNVNKSFEVSIWWHTHVENIILNWLLCRAWASGLPRWIGCSVLKHTPTVQLTSQSCVKSSNCRLQYSGVDKASIDYKSNMCEWSHCCQTGFYMWTLHHHGWYRFTCRSHK